MEIKLIKRELKNGRTSLVLEYYLGYTLGANGTTRPKRKFETLEYFLYTAPRNKAERDHNKINLEMAEKVKAKRLLAEQNEQYGFAVPFKIRTNLVEFIRGMVEQRKDSPGNWGNWDSMLKHLIAYAGTETTFERIDRRFVEGFRTYLAKGSPHEERHRTLGQQPEQLLSEVQGGIEPGRRGGDRPPIARHGGQGHADGGCPPRIPHDRGAATAGQDRLLLPGAERRLHLLVSDGHALERHQQADVGRGAGVRRRHARGLPPEEDPRSEYLDISEQAVRYMGPRGRADERVFSGLKYSAWHNLALREWCMKAGITAHHLPLRAPPSPYCNSHWAPRSTPSRSSSDTAS